MKIGIIGYGGMGSYHSSLISQNKNLVCGKIYDIDPLKLEKARENGFETANSMEELLSDKAIERVVVAVPNDLHYEIAKAVMEHNKDVLLEKPATISEDEFKELMKISQQYNVDLSVHQNRRFDNDFLKIKELISSDKIGKIYRIESNVMAANGIPGEWRKKKKHGGGMILDWGVHLIDQMVNIFGQTVSSLYYKQSHVYGEEVDDGFISEFTLKNGVSYSINVGTNSFITRPRWTVFGTDGTAEIETWNKPLKIVKPKVYDEVITGIKAGNGFTKTMRKRDNSLLTQYIPYEEVPADIYYQHLLKGKVVNNCDVLYVLSIINKMLLREEQYIKF